MFISAVAPLLVLLATYEYWTHFVTLITGKVSPGMGKEYALTCRPWLLRLEFFTTFLTLVLLEDLYPQFILDYETGKFSQITDLYPDYTSEVFAPYLNLSIMVLVIFNALSHVGTIIGLNVNEEKVLDHIGFNHPNTTIYNGKSEFKKKVFTFFDALTHFCCICYVHTYIPYNQATILCCFAMMVGVIHRSYDGRKIHSA